LLLFPEATAEGGERVNSGGGEQLKNWVPDREASEQQSGICAALREAAEAKSYLVKCEAYLVRAKSIAPKNKFGG
jgi:hypothetical protein